MLKRKRDASDSSKKEEREHWTIVMDDALIDVLLQQHNIDNRVSETFTTTTYDNIVKELSEKLNKNIDNAHPHAEEWRSKPFPNYEKICILYGKDRATREHAETTREFRQRLSDISQEETMCTIEGIDQMCAQVDILLENFDNISSEDVKVEEQPWVHSNNPQVANSNATTST
ncbi:hypothetical protein Cni_G20009 [Canna indica]|uniref:Myb/SANT-like domain-containing protein n=1 Tax=Canna indica TaxID=4628 RepID=A0AAQ3KLM0_9LILI|nr:hypothetical protein Cni_G20009 [Canna indica]